MSQWICRAIIPGQCHTLSVFRLLKYLLIFPLNALSQKQVLKHAYASAEADAKHGKPEKYQDGVATRLVCMLISAGLRKSGPSAKAPQKPTQGMP